MIATGDSETEAQNDLADIYHGILRDDTSLLNQGINNRVNINTTFKGDSNLQHIGMTPLSLAAALNKINALKFLLANGAHVNDTFASLRTTALMTASFHGHARIVDALLRGGSNVQAIDLQGSTALGYAFGGSRSVEVIELLLRSGININQKNMLGMSALLLVAGYGDDKLVKMVLEAGADPNSANDFGHSALHLVIVGKRSQLKKLTKSAGDVMTLDNFNNLKSAEVALKDWAARNKKVSVDSRKLEKAASLMTNIGSKLQKNPTRVREDSEQEVIKQRVEAVWYHRQEKLLFSKKSAKKSGRLENLLSCRGNKKNKNNEESQTYLSAPSRSSKRISTERDKDVADLKERFARILVMIADAGCDVGATEKTFGMTALDMAILLEDVDSTGLLVARGADPEHLLKMFALSDMHEAIVSGDKKLVEKLLVYDVDLDINHHFSTFNVDSKEDELDEDAGEFIISDGVTPLTVAVQMPEEEGNAYKIVKILLKNKADVDKIGPGGTTPLMEACRVGNLKLAEMLIANGADVNAPCPRYNQGTPIIIAAVYSRVELAQLLADKLAKLDIETTDGRCALTEAYRNDNTKILETVLRGSLGQSFSNKGSFTYEMVVKYQRPDKTDINVILKLVGEEVKRRDEERRMKELADRKKYSINFMRRVSEPTSEVQDKLKNSEEATNSDAAVIFSAHSDSNLLEDSTKKRVNDVIRLDPSQQEIPNNFEVPKFPLLEAHKVALISKIEQNADRAVEHIKSNLESEVKMAIDERVNEPFQNVCGMSEYQRNWPEVVSDPLKNGEQDTMEEDWEDDTDFQEQYYPASGIENGRPCLMTTPILGRCTQVRQNFAQADTYLKDVVKTGNLQKISRSVMRTINDEFEEVDNETHEQKRTETDI